MYPVEFDRDVKITLGFEGGTNADPVDRGGLTKFGVNEKQYPDVRRPDFDVHDALAIYFKDYWIKSGCNEMPYPLSMVVFDCAVNCGQPSAIKWVQETLKLIGNNIVIDGKMGIATETAILTVGQYRLIAGIMGCRLRRYVDLIGKYPAQIKYYKGWTDRAVKIQMLVAKS